MATEKEMIEKRDSDLQKVVDFIVKKITKLEYENLKCYNSEVEPLICQRLMNILN